MTETRSVIIRLYFALVSAATLITLMIGTINLIGYGLRAAVFPATNVPSYMEVCSADARYRPIPADSPEAKVTDEEWERQCEKRNEMNIENHKRQQASNAINSFAMLLVSVPLFILHFRFVYRDWMGEPVAKKK